MKIMIISDDDEGQIIPCEKEVDLIKLNVHLECTANLNSIFFLELI